MNKFKILRFLLSLSISLCVKAFASNTPDIDNNRNLHLVTQNCNVNTASFNCLSRDMVSQIIDYIHTRDFKSIYVTNKIFKSIMDQPYFWFKQSIDRGFIANHKIYDVSSNYKPIITGNLVSSYKKMYSFRRLAMNATGDVFAGELNPIEGNRSRSVVFKLFDNQLMAVGSDDLVDSLVVHTINPSGSTLWGIVKNDQFIRSHFMATIDNNDKPGNLAPISDGKIDDQIVSLFHKKFLDCHPDHHLINFVSQSGHIIVGDVFNDDHEYTDYFISSLNEYNQYDISFSFKKDLNARNFRIHDMTRDGSKVIFKGRLSSNNKLSDLQSVSKFSSNIGHLDSLGRPTIIYPLNSLDGKTMITAHGFSADGQSIIGVEKCDQQVSVFKTTFEDNKQRFGPIKTLFSVPGSEEIRINATSSDHRVISFISGYEPYSIHALFFWTQELGIVAAVDLMPQLIDLDDEQNLLTFSSIKMISNNGNIVLLNLLYKHVYDFFAIATIPQLLQR